MSALDNLFGLRRLLLGGSPIVNAAGREIFAQTFNLLGGWTVAEGVDDKGKATVELTPPATGSGTGTGVGGAPLARIRVLGAGIPGGGSDDSHSGLGARDGVTPVAGDTVLDVGHSTPALRGYWLAAAGAWSRPTFYDEDDDVAALFGTFTTIQAGTVGTGQAWRQSGGITILGGKIYDQVLGNPDTVYGANGTIGELLHEYGTATTRGRAVLGVDKTKITITTGATAVVATFDPIALGFVAGDMFEVAPMVRASWATGSKRFAGTRFLLADVGTPPVIIESRTQQAADGSAGAGGYLTLNWLVTGNTLQLTATNNRANDCIIRAVTWNGWAFE